MRRKYVCELIESSGSANTTQCATLREEWHDGKEESGPSDECSVDSELRSMQSMRMSGKYSSEDLWLGMCFACGVSGGSCAIVVMRDCDMLHVQVVDMLAISIALLVWMIFKWKLWDSIASQFIGGSIARLQDLYRAWGKYEKRKGRWRF